MTIFNTRTSAGLMTRDRSAPPVVQTRDLTSRTIELRANTVNLEARTVDAAHKGRNELRAIIKLEFTFIKAIQDSLLVGVHRRFTRRGIGFLGAESVLE